MSGFDRRKTPVVVGLLAVAGLVALAGAVVTSADALRIVAPPAVTAGQPIVGYVTGGCAPRTVGGIDSGGQALPAVSGPQDPLYFNYPTYEPQAGTCFSLIAHDGGTPPSPSGGPSSGPDMTSQGSGTTQQMDTAAVQIQ
jgi:hypothetical protein